MDRNTVVGLFLIGSIIIGYGLLTKPNKEEIEAAKHKSDSIAKVIQEQELARVKEQAVKDSIAALDVKKDIAPVINDSARSKQLENEYGLFADAADGTNTFYTIENKDVLITFSSKGGRVYKTELKNYKTWDKQPLVLFNGDSTNFGFNFFAQNRSISTNDLYFVPGATTNSLATEDNPASISFKLKAGESSYIEYTYRLAAEGFMVDFDVKMEKMHNIIAGNTNDIDLLWSLYLPQLEKVRKNESMYSTAYYKFFQDEVESLKARSDKDQEADLPTKLKWVAFKQQFFASVFISNDVFENGFIRTSSITDENSKYLKYMESELKVPFNRKESQEMNFKFYFGPTHFTTLKKYGDDLEELVTIGGNIIRWVNRFVIIPIFNWLDNFIGNYGIIILLLTIIIKIGLLPLTYRSYLSQAKMKVLKPQIEEINKKIPKDKAMERQQATMALYKKVGVNPMGGCIPLLLQMPILFAMYRFFPSSIELRQEAFLWAKDLSTYDSILNLPFNIPMYGDHISLFTILMTITTYLSMKNNNQNPAATGQMAGMLTMMYIMPVMLMLVLNNFSAGLTYYLFLTNIITFGQNSLFKLFVNENEILRKLEANKKKPQKKSKFQERLEDMAKQRGYKLPKK